MWSAFILNILPFFYFVVIYNMLADFEEGKYYYQVLSAFLGLSVFAFYRLMLVLVAKKSTGGGDHWLYDKDERDKFPTLDKKLEQMPNCASQMKSVVPFLLPLVALLMSYLHFRNSPLAVINSFLPSVVLILLGL